MINIWKLVETCSVSRDTPPQTGVHKPWEGEGREGVGEGRGCHQVMHGRSRRCGHRPSHRYNAGTEHVGFSPTRQTLIACTKREAKGEAFGESHEGRGRGERARQSSYTHRTDYYLQILIDHLQIYHLNPNLSLLIRGAGSVQYISNPGNIYSRSRRLYGSHAAT